MAEVNPMMKVIIKESYENSSIVPHVHESLKINGRNFKE